MTILTLLAFSASSWAMIGSPLANHLWQSTLFAGVAGLLTLMLRKNHAQARYLLWLTASAKFLIPFALLVGMGSHLGWSKPVSITQSGFTVVMQEIGQPFAPTNPSPVAAPVTASALAVLARLLPTLLLIVWFGGCATVLVFGWLRWRRLTATIRMSTPVQNGRELETLRRLERSAGIAKHIDLIIAQSAVEPGILGIFRPVLFLPARISDRLTNAQLEAIVTHELCHVRRRDNLAAAVHMLIEAIYWFHPLVWWIGTRLVDERECACDEDVLRLGSEPQVYAEGILTVCEFYLESPLFCAAGVTGSNLKKRIEAIMNHRTARSLDFSRMLLLCVAGLLAVAAPIVFGLLSARQISAHAPETAGTPLGAFELVSVTPSSSENEGTAVRFIPGRLTLANWTVGNLIAYAYGGNQLSGGPSWIYSQTYVIDVKVEDSLAYQSGKLINTNMAGRFPPGLRHEQLRLMIQSLLADRFKLRLTRETRQLPFYALVISKNGSKLQKAKPGDTYSDGIINPDGLPVGPHMATGEKGHLTVQALPMATVALLLSSQLGGGANLVVDKTGLTGEYDFTLDWTPDKSQSGDHGPSIFSAIQEQLGLELKEQTAPVEMLVIEHAEKITGNEQSQSRLSRQPLSLPDSSSPVSGNQVGASSQAQEAASSPRYEVASIKLNNAGTASLKTGKGIIMQSMMFTPGTFTAQNTSLQELIRVAYGVDDYQISGLPNSLTSTLYDVDAKAGSSVVDKLQKLDNEQRDLESLRMLQALLMSRFKLTVHRETKELPVYSLVVSEPGKLQEASGDCGPHPNPVIVKADTPQPPPPCGSIRVFPWIGHLDGQKVAIKELVGKLSGFTKTMVFDRTNLTGRYDLDLKWLPGPSEFGPRPAYLPSSWQPDPSSTPLLAAIQQQLGLKLESQTGAVSVLVIDHAEKPSEN